ncbi:MAG: lipid-A-disaccharide synthase [Bacteroidota bacterium]
MKYFIIAGEASGDLHGSNLIKAIKQQDAGAEFQFWGGDEMNAQAKGLLKHYKEVAIMGFVEVVMNLRTIFSNIDTCKNQIDTFNPDVVILIDYPGFNLRIAEYCKGKNIKTVYYISPKVWAWKENRARKLEQFVDKLLLIFPFEVEYFKKWNVNATFVGNPLLDAIEQFVPNPAFKIKHSLDNRLIIALMPGSRKQEISKILPMMIEATERYTDYQLVIAGAPGMDPGFYKPYLNKRVSIVFNETYDLLNLSTAAVVCSGTATLETALFNVPQVCGYIANSISYAIAKLLVNIKYISLVNLNLNRNCITELIQKDFSVAKLTYELDKVLPNGSERERMLKDYAELRTILGGEGASSRAAKEIISLMQQA